jgi:hypothetical protein
MLHASGLPVSPAALLPSFLTCRITSPSYLKSASKVTVLGPISWLLGLEIIRDRANRGISINQTSYIDSVLQDFNMEACKPAAVPLDPNVRPA